jgi:hypothetical protein
MSGCSYKEDCGTDFRVDEVSSKISEGKNFNNLLLRNNNYLTRSLYTSQQREFPNRYYQYLRLISPASHSPSHDRFSEPEAVMPPERDTTWQNHAVLAC